MIRPGRASVFIGERDEKEEDDVRARLERIEAMLGELTARSRDDKRS